MSNPRRRPEPDSLRGIARVVLATLGLASLVGCGTESSEPPNIVLITVDTLRADHLSCYGYGDETSPRIDALAKESVVFDRAIAASGRTVPSHASIMTSRFVRGHSVGHLNGSARLEGEITLADRLGAAGYDTAAFIGNLLLTENTGLGQGFDLYDDELDTPELNRPNIVERLARDTTERAIRWLAQARHNPVFLWVHYQDPHGPYTPPEEDHERFAIEASSGERPLNVGKNNSGRGGIPAYQKLPDVRHLSGYRSRYAGEIFYADKWIGELLDAVEETSKGRDNVIVLTSDHGESFGENDHYLSHGDSTTPEIAHVPLIIRAPGLPPGRRPEVVSHVDILPTVLELAGLDALDQANGVALGPVIRNEQEVPDRFVYCDVGLQVSAYRGDEFFKLGAARRGRKKDSEPKSWRWRRFRWDGGGSWDRVEKAGNVEEEIPDRVLAYLRQRTEINHLPPPDPQLIEQLRALGYVDP